MNTIGGQVSLSQTQRAIIRRWRWYLPAWFGLWFMLHPVIGSAQGNSEMPIPTRPMVLTLNGNFEVDEIVEVTVDGLDQWTKTQGNTPWRLVPFVNERPLPGLYPIAVNLKNGKLQFHLLITPANKSSWHNLLSPPTFIRNVQFSVGLETQDPFNTALTLNENPAKLIVVEIEWAIASLIVGVGFALSFFWLASKTHILMERIVLVDGGFHLRLSLAKVQLAIWFFVIFSSFIVIWLSTGHFDIINGSIIGILGISAGTALGDSYIRSNRNYQNFSSTESDAESIRSVESQHVPASQRIASQGFARFKASLVDLISDSEGYSIYRFQMVAWTVVFVTIFLSSVYYNLVMPEFKAELLYLLGLSSGSYVAHRFPETVREARLDVDHMQRMEPDDRMK